jgi:hypothetical protein
MMLLVLPRASSRLLKYAQYFEKHPLGAERAFPNILYALKLITNFTSFSPKFFRDDAHNSRAFLGLIQNAHIFKNTLLVPRGRFLTFWGHCSWFQILLSVSKFFRNDIPNDLGLTRIYQN